MKKWLSGVVAAVLLAGAVVWWVRERWLSLQGCAELVNKGARPIAEQRTERFLGKVQEYTALCRGGSRAVEKRAQPWLDWAGYYATGDAGTRVPEILCQFLGVAHHICPNGRGVDGAALDLEYQRIELIKFNLHDNSGTYREYVTGRDGKPGSALKVWEAMRLPPEHPRYADVGGDAEQVCRGELIRHRNLTGICNDLKNPLMGSTGQPFARNVQFETTYPRLGKNELARNRHGDRLGLLTPDPQVISRKLLSRAQSAPAACNEGHGLPGDSADARCDYRKAPFFNVLAAFWIQFMTHDWFSHLEEGHNRPETMPTGCRSQRVGNVETPLTAEQAAALGCRADDLMDASYAAETEDPATFTHDGKEYLERAYRTTSNNVTAWWDASQIYGYDEVSRQRVKRDPEDPAKLSMVAAGDRGGGGEAQGYLPLFAEGDPINPAWAGQEATAFADNFTVGVSFFHNVFAREHNLFVDEFRRRAAADPDGDSGLRDPAAPERAIRNREVSGDELFEAARLVVAAEIAKIHTIEWTPQLLYDEPLFVAMNANWSGFFGEGDNPLSSALAKITSQYLRDSPNPKTANQWYSVFASGAGIFGLGSRVYTDDAIFAKYDPDKTDVWDLADPDHVNGGVNHFGSPFNFPEEFVTVYRLHPLVPDLIEMREPEAPDRIVAKVSVGDTFRAAAATAIRARGLAQYGLSMGRQRLGLLTLQNHPQFLQNLRMPRLRTPTELVDVVALDILRDREHGLPRFNEFRRQYGLETLRSFDDFVDRSRPEDSLQRRDQERQIAILREVYGQHRCDDTKVISDSQLLRDGSPITDCLGHADGSMVDNVEDLDVVVGLLAEFVRPHGFAISETQFQVFILNASRRLFSDRFFTSSFRPEFYTHLGVAWVNDNGPDGKVMEQGEPNGHKVQVSPLKRVLMRTIPELAPELEPVVNAFDPWARDRGEYYSLEWKPRPGAEADEAFGTN